MPSVACVISHACSQSRFVIIDEDAHQLGDGEAGMRVVHLDGDFGGEVVEGLVGRAIAAHDVVDGAGNEEIFLQKPKFFSGRDSV